MNRYELWLSMIPGVGSRTILKLRRALNDNPDFARVIYEMTPKDRFTLVRDSLPPARGRHSPESIARQLNSDLLPDPQACAELLEESGIQFVSVNDPEYPRRLLQMDDPPFGLYFRGRLPSDTDPCVGIVGTRMASPYGRDQARIFAEMLAEAGVQIVSGMARGVDGIAGRGALDAEGASFAVLGCGVDICYPKENRDLYEALCERGGVLSEYPPGTQPQAGLFPTRNRIISGLSDLLLVIEAREQSGTLITVDRALEKGIDVYALPGRVTDRNSAGCNRLIRQGAGIATCPQDILEALFGMGAADSGAGAPATDPAPAPGTPSAAGQLSPAPVQLSFDFEVFGSEDLPEDIPAEIPEPPRGAAPAAAPPDGDAGYSPERFRDTPADSPPEPVPPVLRSLSPLQRAVYDALDESTPRCTDELLSAVNESLSRRVSSQEVLRAITILSVRGLAQEIRVGNYVCIRAEG